MRLRLSLFWGTVIILVGIYLVLRFGVAYLSQFIIGAENPLPVPAALLSIYLILALIGLAVYISMDEDNQRAFITPIVGFLRGPVRVETRGDRVFQGARWRSSDWSPCWWDSSFTTSTRPARARPRRCASSTLACPRTSRVWENPFRDADAQTREQYLTEGRNLFYINCRPCHGTKADGTGPMARGFRLKPANFTDPGTIATVVEAFAFWRARKGNPGLPIESSPWDSAMPKWEVNLTDEQIWKILLAEYDIAGVEPRKPE